MFLEMVPTVGGKYSSVNAWHAAITITKTLSWGQVGWNIGSRKLANIWEIAYKW